MVVTPLARGGRASACSTAANRNLELEHQDVALAHAADGLVCAGSRHRAVCAGHHGDHVFAVAADEDQGRSGRLVDPLDGFEFGAGSFRSASAVIGKAILADGARHVHAHPARRAASAWLAPLPPAAVEKPLPATVSPGLGKRCVVAMRSMLMEPKTVIMRVSFQSFSFAATLPEGLTRRQPP
jgi:hypothetical protein